jgi:hypothetical protein
VNFREQSDKTDWDDWTLAREAVCLRRVARNPFFADPQAEADRQMREAFTADEVRRIDAYLAAGKPDTGRLAAIEARLDGATDDTKWLAEQLKQAWADLNELRDCIDGSGSLMHTSYVASAIRYVIGSRETG